MARKINIYSIISSSSLLIWICVIKLNWLLKLLNFFISFHKQDLSAFLWQLSPRDEGELVTCIIYQRTNSIWTPKMPMKIRWIPQSKAHCVPQQQQQWAETFAATLWTWQVEHFMWLVRSRKVSTVGQRCRGKCMQIGNYKLEFRSVAYAE